MGINKHSSLGVSCDFHLTSTGAVKLVFAGFAAPVYFCLEPSNGVFQCGIGVNIGVRKR